MFEKGRYRDLMDLNQGETFDVGFVVPVTVCVVLIKRLRRLLMSSKHQRIL